MDEVKAIGARFAKTKSAGKKRPNFPVRINFLLHCSQPTLGAFELARLGEVTNLRGELHALLDRMIDQTTQAALARWFRNTDREALKDEVREDPVEWAKRQIRNLGRSEDEIEENLTRALSIDPGKAHRTAALTYQKRNIAEGKCMSCPLPMARHSVRYCERHLMMALARHYKRKGISGGQPGTLDWLYSDGTTQSKHGRQPGTLAALAKSRQARGE